MTQAARRGYLRMIQGFLGKKIGMTQVFRDDGRVIPVTVVEAGPCIVTQIKTQEKDGYEAVQLGFGEVKRLNKPRAGHLQNRWNCRYLREVQADDVSEFQVGQTIGVDIFEPGEVLDVIGKSKGRGFAGTMKRHGFWRRASHSRSVRPVAGARVNWRRHHPREGVQRAAHGGTHGKPADYGKGAGGSQYRLRPQPVAAQGRRSRSGQWAAVD